MLEGGFNEDALSWAENPEWAEKYAGIDFRPPQSVADAAASGLELRRKFKRGGLSPQEAGKAGIGSGVTRAVSLKNRQQLSPDTIGRMVSYFARHAKDLRSEAARTSSEPTAGEIAWKLWGGNPGKSWAEKIKGQMDRAEGKGSDYAELGDSCTLDFTRCERSDGSFYGTGGQCRLGKETGPKEKMAEAFSAHIKEYSYAMPGRSFNGEDIANLVNEAANLPGEAGENVMKLQMFVMKDRGGVIVAESERQVAERVGAYGVRELNKKDVPWAMTPEYRQAMEKMGYGEAFKKVDDAKDRLESNKKIEDGLKEKIEKGKEYGIDPKDSIYAAQLKNVRKQMRDDKEVIKDAPRRFSQFGMAMDGADGHTGTWTRSVTVADNGGAFHRGFDKNRKVDAQQMQDAAGDVMKKRATLDKLEGAKLSIAAIGTFSGGSELKDRNESVLYTYTHEVGHQVYFRAGSPPPPPNSVSNGWKEKGITGYAATNKDENFAEAFALYTFNPKVLKEVDPPLYDWVNSTVTAGLVNAGNKLPYED